MRRLPGPARAWAAHVEWLRAVAGEESVEELGNPFCDVTRWSAEHGASDARALWSPAAFAVERGVVIGKFNCHGAVRICGR
jgi:hypothetical protein